jgi:hypothetical protein
LRATFAAIVIVPVIIATRVLPRPPYQLPRASFATTGPTDKSRMAMKLAMTDRTSGE